MISARLSPNTSRREVLLGPHVTEEAAEAQRGAVTTQGDAAAAKARLDCRFLRPGSSLAA